ncbi:M20/M25/M40 family metallo-hydrolase, partial [bacterium]|nr:M20/M25/M40 family metallo-hydrolase [bacterium]
MDTQNIISRFMDLCRINSVSGSEARTARYCVQILNDLGLSLREDKAGNAFGGNQGNLIATLEGKLTNVPPIMLNAHMDTVESGGEIVPVVSNDRIISSGNTILGADNRAGIVMILEGLRLLRESMQMHGRIEVVFTVGEEVGLTGAQNLDYSLLTARHGFSLDSSGLGRIAQGAPYYNAIDVVVKGRMAHAAVNAEQGLNSITLMADGLAQLSFGHIDNETTANVGCISGGLSRNVVPAECHAVMEVRS